MIPAPGRVLLRPIETESSIGRIQLLDRTRENWTPNQYEVVGVGKPLPCDDRDCERGHWDSLAYPDRVLDRHHAIPCAKDDWVLVRHRSVVPTDDDNLFIAWQDDILAILSLRSDPQSATGSSAR